MRDNHGNMQVLFKLTDVTLTLTFSVEVEAYCIISLLLVYNVVTANHRLHNSYGCLIRLSSAAIGGKKLLVVVM